MPVYLDEVPDEEDRISRPVTLRWGILLIVIMLAGVLLTLWQWTGERRGVSFWLTAMGLPFGLWLSLVVFRHIGYRLELNGEAGWNHECESLKASEIARGQRFAWVLDTWVQTQAGRGTGSLSAAMKLATPLLKTAVPRTCGHSVRHSRITDFDAGPDAVKSAIEKVAVRLKSALERLPETLPCWLMFDGGTELPAQDEAEILQLLTLKSGRELRQLSAKGMNALDKWLDNRWDKPSALIVLSLALRPSPAENDAEAIASLVLCNRKSHQFPDAVRLHRPQLSNHETLTRNMAHSLRWANVTPDDIRTIWISGEAVTGRPGLNKACEENTLALSLTDDINNIDTTLGYAGQASPWVSVALAAVAVREQGPQLIAAQPDPASDDIWLTAITAEERQKDVIRE
ncbi:hypothetical protein [Klebsiella aerogenes]|uniref:Type VI secretion protein n=1 Tax=Klebsiella aerogenes TaxID=548 RepID=A0AAP9QZA8_KLEAE|nr:hypothetical protein [Klebsiella aerogenes]QMR41580.1 hypothetical protein HV331_19680 [Klebsiella aerogenes]